MLFALFVCRVCRVAHCLPRPIRAALEHAATVENKAVHHGVRTEDAETAGMGKGPRELTLPRTARFWHTARPRPRLSIYRGLKATHGSVRGTTTTRSTDFARSLLISRFSRRYGRRFEV